ncbi:MULTISPECIES: sulfur carrier protein ThiS adenylyltransferase ThiF [unclassified Lentimicrobium]|uniref:sulfur carrier protein ThiS adenylyltransferase ThiF n=1 Tax=unclassified Lentimicrobium TaxID=2677434 RepID=UPI001555DF95|nr:MULTISPECIES: sulfur carrier protein ThiS adenylyltransferase ThiF [unclassified Lentimicrobium]NPD46797.1 sulfur carrier protein ThiS adenylyltransferase ThiF [Lentimicrobium sp. S6]NPD85600.1 sulfur carrier protein ThiS adenylyltransferase ThiF [Lentimicrobium sp. L6]
MKFEKIKEILLNKTVGIAGCGGLGSNCAVALARVGVGKLIIADFDVIEESNLNRQYYFHHQIGKQKVYSLKENIHLINPDVQISAHQIKLEAQDIYDLYKNCDVIVEAFDNAEMKQIIIETICEKLSATPLVIGLGMAGWGDIESIHLRNSDNLYICGDEKSEVSEEFPPLAPRVGIVANMQADTVLELLLKEK